MKAAEDAVHLKALLAADLTDPMYIELMNLFVRNEGGVKYGEDCYQPGTTGKMAVDEIKKVLADTDNYYVSPQMVELAQSVAPTMPDEVLLPNDVPCDVGWMKLGRPFRMIDVRMKYLSMTSLMWCVVGDYVRVWHFTHRDDMTDSVNLDLFERFGEVAYRKLPMMSLTHVFEMKFGEELPRGISWDTALPFDAKVEIDEIVNPDGTKSLRLSTDQEIDITQQPTYVRSPLAEFILCIWRLCQQALATITVEQAGRQTRRRAMKQNLPDKPVSVVTLRRIDHKDHGDSHVEWTHRWLVSGHWRHQPIKDGYRWVYIHPYLKGPDDKPILIRQRVKALIR